MCPILALKAPATWATSPAPSTLLFSSALDKCFQSKFPPKESVGCSHHSYCGASASHNQSLIVPATHSSTDTKPIPSLDNSDILIIPRRVSLEAAKITPSQTSLSPPSHCSDAALMHRNTVFGHEQWRAHKSPWRHGRHFLTVLSSWEIVAHLALPVLFATAVAVFVSVFKHAVQSGALSPSIPLLRVASLPFLVTSQVLALLLVFRTNASYGRFEEARKIWGMTVIKTRDFVRQALSWITSPMDTQRLNSLIRHVKAYSFTLKDHLTNQGDALRAELEEILDPDEVEPVMNSTHRPNFIMQVMSEIIARVQVSEWEKITLDNSISLFHYNAGACERIFNTPIPVAFTLLTSRFLIVWHCALPFGLWDVCRWMTIPVAFFSALALFYIEEVGVLIEEPFWILALKAYSRGISRSLDGIIAAHEEICHSHRHSLRSSKEHVVITFEGSSRDIVSPAFSTCLWDTRTQQFQNIL